MLKERTPCGVCPTRFASRKTGRRKARVPTQPMESDILPGIACSSAKSISCVMGGTKSGESPWKLADAIALTPVTVGAAPPVGNSAAESGGPGGGKGTLGNCNAAGFVQGALQPL